MFESIVSESSVTNIVRVLIFKASIVGECKVYSSLSKLKNVTL